MRSFLLGYVFQFGQQLDILFDFALVKFLSVHKDFFFLGSLAFKWISCLLLGDPFPLFPLFVQIFAENTG